MEMIEFALEWLLICILSGLYTEIKELRERIEYLTMVNNILYDVIMESNRQNIPPYMVKVDNNGLGEK